MTEPTIGSTGTPPPGRPGNSSYSEKVTSAAHDALDSIGEKASEAEKRIREKAKDVRQKSGEASDRARGMSDEATAGARSYLREHPAATLAVAFGVGMLFSSLLRR